MNIKEYIEKFAYQKDSQTDEDYYAEKNVEKEPSDEIEEKSKSSKKKKLIERLTKKKKKNEEPVMPVEDKGLEEGDDSDNEQQKLSWHIKLARASHQANPILSIRTKKRSRKKFGKPSKVLPKLLAKSYHK